MDVYKGRAEQTRAGTGSRIRNQTYVVVSFGIIDRLSLNYLHFLFALFGSY